MLPASYTEETLQGYMIARVQVIANVLGLAATDFKEAVNDVLIAYGVNDISEATNLAKIRALAHLQAWHVILDAASAEHNFSVDGGNYSREQIYKNAEATLERLSITYAPYLPVPATAQTEFYEIGVGTTTHYDGYTGPLL